MPQNQEAHAWLAEDILTDGPIQNIAYYLNQTGFVSTGSIPGVAVTAPQFAGGADPTGVKDSSAAFTAAFNYIIGRAVPDVENGGLRLLDELFIPGGEYKITTPGAIWNTFGTTNLFVNGYTIKGAGANVSRIVFTPTAYASLLHNTDQLRFLKIEDVTFIGGNAMATLFDSLANASPGNSSQKANFLRCTFQGTWDDTLRLEGSASANNNDTWIFQDCTALVTCGRTTGADGHITSGTANFASPTGNFTANDAVNGGRAISIPGAGSAGAVLNTTILTYVSPTAVTLAVNAGTSVTTAAASIAAAFFHCGATSNQVAQDQFLNYRFQGGDYAILLGDMCRFDFGGATSIADCTVEMNSTTAISNIYNLPTPTHYGGTNTFGLKDARIQLNTACKLITSAVKYGHFQMDTCSTDGFPVPANQITATVYGTSDVGILVHCTSSRFLGQWEFQYDTNTWQAPSAHHVFDNCAFPQQTDPQNFLVMTALAGNTARGGMPVVKFRDCIGTYTYAGSDYGRAYDVSANWLIAQSGEAARMSRSIKNPAGQLPTVGGLGTTVDIYMPLNCRITDVHFYMPAVGAYNGTTWTYVLTSDPLGANTTLATCAPGSAWNLGFSVHVRDLWFAPTTDAARRLRLTASVVTEGQNSSECVVDYLPGS